MSSSTITKTTIKTSAINEINHQKQYAVIFHNDDFTPMDYVVLILMKIFNKPFDKAMDIMLSVHKSGRGVAGIYDMEVAYEKVESVDELNKEFDMQLLLTVEEV